MTFDDIKDFVEQNIRKLIKTSNSTVSNEDKILNFSGIYGFLKLRFETIMSAGQGSRPGPCTITNGFNKVLIIVNVWTA